MSRTRVALIAVSLWLVAAAPGCGTSTTPTCPVDRYHDAGCRCPVADLGGSPRQICGEPDASYADSFCGCLFDE